MIQTDLPLLELMMSDLTKAPKAYKPTNCWIYWEDSLIKDIRNRNIQDFRRWRGSVISLWEATDLKPPFGELTLTKSRVFNNKILSRIPTWSKFLNALDSFLQKAVDKNIALTLEEFEKIVFEYVAFYGKERGAKSIYNLTPSKEGNPEDWFKVGNNHYSLSILYYYMQYAYCCEFINFDNIQTIIELGGGVGKQVEVIKKLHPHITFILFDIPPMLYICEQFLKSVFKNDTISYRDNIKIQPRKINIFGTWDFPIIEKIQHDLFWNAISLQEMEPDIVNNYLSFVNKFSKSAYLCENLKGVHIAKKAGDIGVLKPTTIQHYRLALSSMTPIDISPLATPIRASPFYHNSFWKRK